MFFSGHVTQKDTRCVRFLPQVVAVEGLRLYQITTHTHAAKIGKSSEETRNALMKFNMPPAYPVEEFLLFFFAVRGAPYFCRDLSNRSGVVDNSVLLSFNASKSSKVLRYLRVSGSRRFEGPTKT